PVMRALRRGAAEVRRRRRVLPTLRCQHAVATIVTTIPTWRAIAAYAIVRSHSAAATRMTTTAILIAVGQNLRLDSGSTCGKGFSIGNSLASYCKRTPYFLLA